MTGNGETVTRKRLDTYEETLLGLPYSVYVHDAVIEERNAATDELLGHIIPNLDGLAAAVATIRAQMPEKLSPAEIKFMRKALDQTGQEFAKNVGVDPATLSRWENGAQTPDKHMERLLRHYVWDALRSVAPAVACDPLRISTMDIAAAWPAGKYPVIDMVLVWWKTPADSESAEAWDRARRIA